jgi:sialate O-acetylesterase
VLWYQGESNIIACNDGLRYADKVEALITGWRTAWNRSDLPFYCVQLAPFLYSRRKDKLSHTEQALPELWEAQAASLAIPHTGLVPTTDLVDDVRNIHPGHKREVGTRLASLALARTYGRQGFADGAPMFDTIEMNGAAAIVRFRNVGAGLIARDGQPLTEFEVAGADGQFVPAQATIRNSNTVVVSSPQVSTPTVVRFAWRETAQPNLCNKAGWPAFPFRTNGPLARTH